MRGPLIAGPPARKGPIGPVCIHGLPSAPVKCSDLHSKETEAPRGCAPPPRSHSRKWLSGNSNPSLPSAQAPGLTLPPSLLSSASRVKRENEGGPGPLRPQGVGREDKGLCLAGS